MGTTIPYPGRKVVRHIDHPELLPEDQCTPLATSCNIFEMDVQGERITAL